MISAIDSVLETYLGTYRDLIDVEVTDEHTVLSFPFHLAAGHRIEIAVSPLGRNRCVISDSARTLGEIRAAGYSVTDGMREKMAKLAGTSQIRFVEDFLILECERNQLGDAIQRFLEVSKTIGDVYLVHKHKELPNETLISAVREALQSLGIHYKENRTVKGELDAHSFDMVAPSNGRPGLALAVLAGQNTKSQAQIWAFKCDDVRRGEWCKKEHAKLAIVYESDAQHRWSKRSKEILADRADIAVGSDEITKLPKRIEAVSLAS